MQPPRPPATLEYQADMLDYLASRAGPTGNIPPGGVFISVSKSEVEDLRHIADRLRRMSRHEHTIRKIVTGR